MTVVVVDIGRSLREGFFMFWDTVWPLVLGFGLAGAAQAFVSQAGLQRLLGDHRPPAVLRASAFGMVSSSCSYAASAMAKSLFKKGADFVSSMVFMFASTNLVVELGIVLAVLIGWQFAAAEIVGGAVMIALLACFGGLVFSSRMVEAARRRVGGDTEHGHDHADLERGPGTTAGWADAATYTMGDLKMLRKEILIGYVVAGFLAVLVPASWWNELFLHGHGVWTQVENALVGPVIAFASFVCSIGNIPLAAALWKGGIGFGGVVSFVFADLLAAPLVLIYRRYYGGALTVRMVGLFWALMATAGLIVQVIFDAAGLVPVRRSGQVVTTRFHWNYTTDLDVAFLLVFALMYWLYRHRDRLAAVLATDPVCGMTVNPAFATASRQHHWFCSDRCAERYDQDPARYG